MSDSCLFIGFIKKTALQATGATCSYILCAVAIGAIAPFDDPLLTNGGVGAGHSPLVVGLGKSQFNLMPAITKATVTLSCFVSAQSSLLLASRTLCAMSELGHAPQFLRVRNR